MCDVDVAAAVDVLLSIAASAASISSSVSMTRIELIDLVMIDECG